MYKQAAPIRIWGNANPPKTDWYVRCDFCEVDLGPWSAAGAYEQLIRAQQYHGVYRS